MKKVQTTPSGATTGQKYWHYALTNADQANLAAKAANDCRVALDAARNWVSNAEMYLQPEKMLVFAFLWAVVSVAEYMISVEIYYEMVQHAVKIIFAGVVAIGVLNSHFLRLQSKSMMEFEVQRELAYQDGRMEPEIREHLVRKRRNNLLAGLFTLLVMMAVMTFLSVKRAHMEIAAGLRDEDAGIHIIDAFPVILYAAEVFFGIYLLALIKYITASIRSWHLKQKHQNALKACVASTSRALAYYESAKAHLESLPYEPASLTETIDRYFYKNPGNDDYTETFEFMEEEEEAENFVNQKAD